MANEKMSVAEREKKIQERITFERNKLGPLFTKDDEERIRRMLSPTPQKGPKPKEYRDDAATRMMLEINQRNEVLKQQEEEIRNEGRLGEAQKARIKFEQLIADLKSKPKLTDDQKSLLAREDEIKAVLAVGEAQEKVNEELQKQIDLLKLIGEAETREELRRQKRVNQEIAARWAQEDALAARERAMQRDVDGMRMGRSNRERMQGRSQIEERFSNRMQDNEIDFATDEIDQETYEKRLALLEEFQERELASWEKMFDKRKEMERDSTAGAQRFMEDYIDAAENAAEQTERLFSTAFGAIEDAIADFVTKGEFSFKKFADAILEQLTRIMVNQALAALLKSAGGGGGGSSYDTAGLDAIIRATSGAGASPAATPSSMDTDALEGVINDRNNYYSQPSYEPDLHFDVDVKAASAASERLANEVAALNETEMKSMSTQNELQNTMRGRRGYGAAGGIQYVPYDGFQAVLHQGEKVVPANKVESKTEQPISVTINMPPNSTAPQMNEMEWQRMARSAVRSALNESRLRHGM
jgi:lambda family phage tail tape measure protein